MGVTEQADVLVQGDDRERWRPSRRLVVLAVVVALLAAGGSGAYAYQRHERDLDQRAAKAVSLSLAGFDAVMSGQGVSQGYPMMIANDGPAPATVISAQLVGPGYRPSPSTLRIAGHTTETLLVRPGSGCDDRLYASPPTGIRVVVRTTRGTMVRRTLALLGDDLDLLQSQERVRCGMERPAQALLMEPLRVAQHGRDVWVTFRVDNSSRFRLTVDRITAPAGVTVRGGPPFALPPSSPRISVDRTLTVVLRVTSCSALSSVWDDQSVGIQPGPGLPTADSLVVRVSNGRETQTTRAVLQTSADQGLPSIDGTSALLQAASCGVP